MKNFDPQTLKPYPSCEAYRRIGVPPPVPNRPPGDSPNTAAHAGALGLAGVASEPAAIDDELALSHPAHTSRHCCAPSSQGEQSRFSTSPQCHRENLIENRGPEHRIRPPPVSCHRGPVAPPTGAPPPG
jgi:hypothetical protein